MSEIKMNEFGIALTGRPYGKDCYEKISRRSLTAPFTLNFTGVISLGSSFGEEVVVPLCQAGSQELIITSANPVVRDCLEKIQTDFNLSLVFS